MRSCFQRSTVSFATSSVMSSTVCTGRSSGLVNGLSNKTCKILGHLPRMVQIPSIVGAHCWCAAGSCTVFVSPTTARPAKDGQFQGQFYRARSEVLEDYLEPELNSGCCYGTLTNFRNVICQGYRG